MISMTKPPRRAEPGAGSLTAAVGCCSPIDGSLVCSLAQARCCAHLHRWTAVPLPPPPSHICALRAGPFVGPTAALSTPRPATCTPALCASALLALSRGPLPASPFHTPFRYSKSRAPGLAYAWQRRVLHPRRSPATYSPFPCMHARFGGRDGTRARVQAGAFAPSCLSPSNPRIHTHIYPLCVRGYHTHPLCVTGRHCPSTPGVTRSHTDGVTRVCALPLPPCCISRDPPTEPLRLAKLVLRLSTARSTPPPCITRVPFQVNC